MLQALIDARNNANAQKFLRMLAMAEGTMKKGVANPYQVGFGGVSIGDLSRHPGTASEFRQTDGKVSRTTAAGAYQFIKPTWDALQRKLGLPDFSPRSQDLAALQLIREAGALNDVLQGNFDRAVAKTGRIWASLPSSPYAQPRKSAAFVATALGSPPPVAANMAMNQQQKAAPMENPYMILVPKVNKQTGGAPTPAAVQSSAPMENPYMTLVPQKPKRGFFQELGRQAGLTARHGIEGVAGAADVVTEPIRYLQNKIAGVVGAPQAGQSTSQLAASAADWLGLPKPETAVERVVGDGARLMAGGAGMAGAAGKAAKVVSGPVAKAVMGGLAANPGTQVAAAAGSGVAGGAAREGGANTTGQVVAALAGGLASAAGASGAKALAGSLKKIPKGNRLPVQEVEQRIASQLDGTEIDWKALPEDVRNSVVRDVRKAMPADAELNAKALRHFVDFRTAGATPTRGTLTMDPVQITREKNLAKIGANSASDGQRLATLENANNRALVEGLNSMGAANAVDEVQTGQRASEALQGWLDGRKAAVNNLYASARDSSGRSVALDGAAFTKQASQLLDDNLLGHALPKGVETHLNRIAMGEVPFDVNYAEQLKTVIAKLQRNTNDGQQRLALGMVRQALEDTPIHPQAVAGLAEDGSAAIGMFNQARTEHRNLMGIIEKSPALKALHEGGLAPDRFVRSYVGGAANADDVQRLANLLRSESPEAFQAVKNSIAAELKGKGTGWAADDAAKLGASSFRSGVRSFGDAKLQAFFSPEEMQQLGAIGRVADYTMVQPAGSAVNNSNTAGALVGKALDLAGGFGGKFKLLGIGDQVQAGVNHVQEQQAMDAIRELFKPRVAGPAPLPKPGALFPATVGAGLYGAPPAQQQDDWGY